MTHKSALSLHYTTSQIHNRFVFEGYPLCLELFPQHLSSYYTGWKVLNSKSKPTEIFFSVENKVLVKLQDRSVIIDFPLHFLVLPLEWLLTYLEEFTNRLNADEYVELQIKSAVIVQIIAGRYPDFSSLPGVSITYKDKSVYLNKGYSPYGEIMWLEGELSFREVDDYSKRVGTWIKFQDYLNTCQIEPSPKS